MTDGDPRIPDDLATVDAPTADVTVDASGLFCPQPIVRGSAALRKLSPGRVVCIIATDPGFVPDIIRWARHRTDDLVALHKTADRCWSAWLKRG